MMSEGSQADRNLADSEAAPPGVVPRSRLKPWILVNVCLGVLLVVGIGLWSRSQTVPPLPAEVTQRQYELAARLFKIKYKRPADRIDTLSWLAESAYAEGKLAQAVACFAEIPTEHPVYGRMARYQQASALLALHDAPAAETMFRELIALEESQPTIAAKLLIDARQRLRHILEVELRFEDRHALLRGVLDRGENDGFEAVAGCFPTLLRWNGPEATGWLEEFLAIHPQDPVLQTALGRYRMGQGRLDEARTLLEQVCRARPEDLLARAALLDCYWEAGLDEELAAAMAQLAALDPQEPWRLLLVRGRFALRQQQPAVAHAAFLALLTADRTNIEAWLGISQAAGALRRDSERTHALLMVKELGRIQDLLGKAINEPRKPQPFLRGAELCAPLGLDREGQILLAHARRVAEDDQPVTAAEARFRAAFTGPLQLPQALESPSR